MNKVSKILADKNFNVHVSGDNTRQGDTMLDGS